MLKLLRFWLSSRQLNASRRRQMNYRQRNRWLLMFNMWHHSLIYLGYLVILSRVPFTSILPWRKRFQMRSTSPQLIVPLFQALSLTRCPVKSQISYQSYLRTTKTKNPQKKGKNHMKIRLAPLRRLSQWKRGNEKCWVALRAVRYPKTRQINANRVSSMPQTSQKYKQAPKS